MQDFKAGIELQLRENLTMQLKTMLPLMERMNAQTKVLEQQLHNAKGAKEMNQQLKLMNQHLRAVNTANSSLMKTSGHLASIGDSARRATFGMGGLLGQLRGFAAAYIGFAEVISGVKEGLKFEQEVNALRLSGFNEKQVSAAQKEAFRIGRSGTATSAADALNMMRFASAFTGSPEQGTEIADTGAKFDLAMRKLGVIGSSQGHSAHTLFRIAEKLGAKSPEDVSNVANSLTKLEGMGRGMINLQGFDTQLARTRIAKTLGDRDSLFPLLGHLMLEYGSPFGGSAGGGTGGPGTMIAAFSKAFAAGTMTAGSINKMDELGLIQDRNKLMSKGGKTIEHKNLTTGQDEIIHIQGSGSALSSKNFTVSNLVGADIAAKNPFAYLEGILVPAIEKKDKLGAGGFYKQTQSQQALRLLEVMPGLKNTVQDLITQMVIFHKQYENQLMNYGKAPGVEGIVRGGTATVTRITELQAAWATFNDALFGNHKVINEENRLLMRMTELLNAATAAMPGFINGLDYLVKMVTMPITPASMGQTFAERVSAVTDQWNKPHPSQGPTVGRLLWKGAKSAATDIIHNVDYLAHKLMGPPAAPNLSGGSSLPPEIQTVDGKWIKNPTMQQVIANNKAYVARGRAAGLPPPPMGDSIASYLPYNGIGGAPSHGTGKSFVAPPVIINNHFHPMSGMDYDKTAKHVANAVAPHLDKRNLRNMRMGAAANSKSGGSIQSPAGYAGEGN